MKNLKIRPIKLLAIAGCFFFLLHTGCGTNEKPVKKNEDTLLNWLKRQEGKINEELSKIIVQDNLENPSDTNWTEKTIVVTEYDQTILGELSRQVNNRDSCLLVRYTFNRFMSGPRIIEIGNHKSENCNGKPHAFDGRIDTTKFFIVKNLPD